MKLSVWKGIYFGKKALLWFVYLLFAIYISSLVVSSQALGAKVFFGVVGVVALGIMILFEYLKTIYEKMIYALTVKCNLPEAITLKEKLKEKDLFNGFKQSIIIFDSLLLLDAGKYVTCLDHLQNNQKFFHSTLDYLFIYYHTQMYCYFFLEEEENLTFCLDRLFKLKNSKKKQIRGLFSWHEITGIKYFHQNRTKKCLSELDLVDQNRLNNRELTYLLYLKGQCLLKLNNQSTGHRLLKEAKEIGKTLAIAQLS